MPCLADRIRLGAVCRRIRSSIKLLPPSPQLPWIVLHDGTLFDLSCNVPVYQVRLPGDASCYSAGENMLFLLHNDGRCSLMNALSGDTTQLPELAAVLRKYMPQRQKPLYQRVRKVVMSKPSPDHGPIIAPLVGDTQIILSTCRPTGGINSCLMAMILAPINDIAFLQGSLYALCGHNYGKRVFAFDLPLDKPTPPGDKPQYISGITVVEEVLNAKQKHVNMEQYLVESNGNLLLVMLQKTRKYSCKVWEADMGERRWKKVDGGLDGHALFVSFPCSMSVPAAADGLHGAREDCIYFLHRMNSGGKLGSGAYDMRTETSTPLPQGLAPLLQELTPPVELEFVCGGFGIKASSVWFPTWFSPHNPTLTGGGTCRKGEVKLAEKLRTEVEEAVDEKSWRTCTTYFSFPKLNYVWVPRWICKRDHVD